MATQNRRFNRLANTEEAWKRVRRITVTISNEIEGSLRLTTATDDSSHLATFTDLRDLVVPFKI
jgi:hypothetical protein